MLALLFPLFALTATLVAALPTPPQLTFLYSVNLTFAPPVSIGAVPYGNRDLLPIAGGSFHGPKLSGTYEHACHKLYSVSISSPS
jgi:hypothetical protein